MGKTWKYGGVCRLTLCHEKADLPHLGNREIGGYGEVWEMISMTPSYGLAQPSDLGNGETG